MPEITMTGSADAVDGRVGREGQIQDWADIVAGAGNTVNYTNNGVSILVTARPDVGKWSAIRRGVFLYDPADLPDGATITGGSLSLRVNTISGGDPFGSTMVLGNAPVAAYTSLSTADYFTLYSTPVEHSDTRVAVSSLSVGDRAVWPLNAQALTTFQSLYASGNVFELSVRFDCDFDDIEPTWSADASVGVIFDGWRTATEAYRPILTIEYEVSSTGPGAGGDIGSGGGGNPATSGGTSGFTPPGAGTSAGTTSTTTILAPAPMIPPPLAPAPLEPLPFPVNTPEDRPSAPSEVDPAVRVVLQASKGGTPTERQVSAFGATRRLYRRYRAGPSSTPSS